PLRPRALFLARPPRQLPHDPHGDLRVRLEHPLESRAVDPNEHDIGPRPGHLVAGSFLEKARLPEEVASPEQRRRTALLREGSSDLDLAGANRVHLRPDLSLPIDRFSR